MDTERERLEAAKEEIRSRLSNICGDMPPDDFEELVDSIAANQRKADSRLNSWGASHGDRLRNSG